MAWYNQDDYVFQEIYPKEKASEPSAQSQINLNPTVKKKLFFLGFLSATIILAIIALFSYVVMYSILKGDSISMETFWAYLESNFEKMGTYMDAERIPVFMFPLCCYILTIADMLAEGSGFLILICFIILVLSAGDIALSTVECGAYVIITYASSIFPAIAIIFIAGFALSRLAWVGDIVTIVTHDPIGAIRSGVLYLFGANIDAMPLGIAKDTFLGFLYYICFVISIIGIIFAKERKKTTKKAKK